MASKHKISILSGKFTICQLEKDEEIPHWATKQSFITITRTAEELSIIAPDALVPDSLRQNKGWRCVKVEGPLDFALFGVLASLIAPLSREGISLLAIATYDTDYFLVKETQLERVVHILSVEGHDIAYKEGTIDE